MVRRTSSVSVVLALLVLLNGCGGLIAGAALGAGSVAYYRGSLKAKKKVSMDRAWNATVSAVEAMEFEVNEKKKDAVSAKLEAETAQDDSIQIWLNKEDDTVKFTVRVNIFGDEELSREIFDEIEARL